MAHMIEVRHLVKQYGRFRAVDDLSFTVPAGEAVALWGENGAGKSTTLKCLLGLTRFAGEVRIDGLSVAADPRRVRQRIGYVPQELAYYDLTVARTADLFCALRKLGAERGREVLAQAGLSGHLGKEVGVLSGGLRQRLALALALLSDPPVLLLDEPTANLDRRARRDLMRLLAGCKRAGKTIVFASHREEEVLELADRVLVLAGGRLALEGTPDELAGRLTVLEEDPLTVPEPELEGVASAWTLAR